MSISMKPSGQFYFYQEYIESILSTVTEKQKTSDVCFRVNIRLVRDRKKPCFMLKTEKCRRILLGLAEIGVVKQVKGFNRNEFYWELCK